MVRKNPDLRMGPRYLADLQTFSDLSYADNPNARTIVSLLTRTARSFTDAMKAAKVRGMPEGTFKEWWTPLRDDKGIRPESLDPEGPVFASIDAEARRLARDTVYARMLEAVSSEIIRTMNEEKWSSASQVKREVQEKRQAWEDMQAALVESWERGIPPLKKWRAEEVKEYVKIRRQLLGLEG